MSLLQKNEIANFVKLRPAGVDDIASIRYVHASSFRILAAEQHTEEEIDAYVELINSPTYTDELFRADLTVAWLDDEIIGTAGWSPADDSGKTARIRKVFVRPLFTNVGVGRMLVEAVEYRAEKAGFSDFSVRANMNALPFFEHIGYEITSYGVMAATSGVDLPVAFMRKYETQMREAASRGGQSVTPELKPVTHESFWHHTTEH